MSQFLDSIRDVKKNYKVYDVWEQNQADDVAKRKYLSEILDLPKDKVELTKEKAKAVFRASDMMDKRSEDNCANMEQTTSIVATATALALIGVNYFYSSKLAKKGKNAITKQNNSSLYFVGASFIVGIGILLWGNKKQKEASRIGRFQAKQHELKDAKNFVIYTPEQIETAKNLAKNISNKKDKKSISELFANMKQMSKDKTEYQKWHKQNAGSEEEIKKILSKNFAPEQLAQGEEDKEIIVNIVKDVNMSAENYSENVENVFDTIGKLSMFTNIPIYAVVNKILNKSKNVSVTTKRFAPATACTLFTVPMMLWATHEKKQGSRVGRFVKRQEILDNPELIMAYSKDQLKLAENIKAAPIKKGFFQKLSSNFQFFIQYLKNSKDYKNYKNTTEKENEKLYDVLKQAKISEEQLKNAKNLQEKTFRTFDKIDEMSQRYSEDVEAATEIANQFIGTIIQLSPFLIGFGVMMSIKKGILPMTGVINAASKAAFKKDSSIRIFVNKACEVINKDKTLKKDFLKLLIGKKNQEVQAKFLNHPQLQKLYVDLATSSNIEKYLAGIKKAKNTQEISTIIEEISKDHLKQDAVSKWIRNLTKDILTWKSSKKFKNEQLEKVVEKSGEKTNIKPKTIEDMLNPIKKFFNNYKTLSKTILYGGFIPAFGVPVLLSWAVSSWLTNIQLKAGRIGIMKAVEEVDNPKLFVMNESEDK